MRELETHGYLRRERKRIPGGHIVSRTISCNQPGRHSGEPDHPPAKKPRPAAPKKPLPAVPQPSYPYPTLIQQATDLLTDLRREDPRLLLSTSDTTHLTPGVAAWLERDLTPTAVRQALTTDLPEPLCRPAALLAHRLTAQLPPPPPYRAPTSPLPARYPLRNCDDCDHAFRGPEPGRCGACSARHHSP